MTPFHQLRRAVLLKLNEWSYGIWQWSCDELDALDPVENCLDCNQPLASPDADCATCKASWEEQQRDESIYGAGYEDAMREVEMDRDQ